MRLSIHGFSQQEASKMIDNVTDKNGKTKTIRIDAIDLLILRWFTDFYPSMKKLIIEDKEYGWVKRSKVVDDLPILGITENSVSDRLRKLVHFGLLEYQLVKKEGTFCYYRHGSNFEKMVSVQTDKGIGSNQHGVSVQTGKGVSVQTDNKDSSINNSSIKYMANGLIKCPNCGGKLYRNSQCGCYECSECFQKYF